MLGTVITPAQILGSYRKSDAVIILCQNNARGVVEIAALNEEATRLTGYTNEDLVKQPIEKILPERVALILTEFLEYGDAEHDLLHVLSRVRDFAIKTKNGHETDFQLRIIRGEAMDENPWFHLVLTEEKKVRQNNAFRAMLKENFKGHEIIDERTDLPTRASFIKDLELAIYYVRDKKVSASFAIIEINDFGKLRESHGSAVGFKMHQHVGHICKLKLRGEDTVGTLSEHRLGIILVDSEQEPTRMVLNRLRWAISVSPLALPREELLAKVNIGFAQIDGRLSEAESLGKLEEFMDEMRKKESNAIRLAVMSERREQEVDRRKQNIPVAVDRRKGGDRRKDQK